MGLRAELHGSAVLGHRHGRADDGNGGQVNPDAITDGLNTGGTGAVTNATDNDTRFGFAAPGSILGLQAEIEALETDNKLQTIASPTLVTMNNVTARIERTASEFVQVQQNETATLQEFNVGLRLEITPIVVLPEDASEQPLVRMSLAVVNSSLSNTAADIQATNGFAAEASQELTTEVVIPTGSTFMMGGLTSDQLQDNDEGVPGVRNIPILGDLFNSSAGTDQFTETLFFVTPAIVYPEDIEPKDIAERRYLERRRSSLTTTKADIQRQSDLVQRSSALLEEDE